MSEINQVVDYEGYTYNVSNFLYMTPVVGTAFTIVMKDSVTLEFAYDTEEEAILRHSDLNNIFQDNE